MPPIVNERQKLPRNKLLRLAKFLAEVDWRISESIVTAVELMTDEDDADSREKRVNVRDSTVGGASNQTTRRPADEASETRIARKKLECIFCHRIAIQPRFNNVLKPLEKRKFRIHICNVCEKEREKRRGTERQSLTL